MPVYDYLCADCGPFTMLRPMAEFDAPYPVRSAAPRRLVRFWWRRRCRAWTRPVVPPLPPTSVVPMHLLGARAILQDAAAARARGYAPTRLA